MNTQLNDTIEARVIQNLFYDLATEFKSYNPSCKVRVKLKSNEDFSQWFYPWFLTGGYGKLTTHKALCTKRTADIDKFDRDNLATGATYIFSDMCQIEISNNYPFTAIGDRKCKELTKGVAYTISPGDESNSG